jgi:hypothetical protein
VVLLWLAAATPWHTDSNAYFAELQRAARPCSICASPTPSRLQGGDRRLLALQNKYATRKWLYADWPMPA